MNRALALGCLERGIVGGRLARCEEAAAESVGFDCNPVACIILADQERSAGGKSCEGGAIRQSEGVNIEVRDQRDPGFGPPP